MSVANSSNGRAIGTPLDAFGLDDLVADIETILELLARTWLIAKARSSRIGSFSIVVANTTEFVVSLSKERGSEETNENQLNI